MILNVALYSLILAHARSNYSVDHAAQGFVVGVGPRGCIKKINKRISSCHLPYQTFLIFDQNLPNNKRLYRISKLDSALFFHMLVHFNNRINHLQTSVLAQALFAKDSFAYTLKALAQRMHEAIDKSRKQIQNIDTDKRIKCTLHRSTTTSVTF